MTDTDYSIIPIQECHIEGLFEVVGCVAREKLYLAFLEGPSLEMSRSFVLNNIKYHRPHFVALTGEKVIGWCDITPVDSLERPIFAHAGSLGIGILEEYRGKGLGEALMRAALDQAKLNGLKRVELTVRESNVRAIALYKKIGFRIEGVHQNALKIGNTYSNQLVMALLF